MMDSPISATELMGDFAAKEEYERGARERDRQIAERAEQRALKLRPFHEELVESGIEAVHDPATGRRSADPRVIALALDHLARDGYDDETRAAIAQHLEVRAANVHWDRIVGYYLAARGPAERDALAAALMTSARSEHVDQLMDFVNKEALGTSRVFFLRPINRLRRGYGQQFVAQLADDPILGREATAIMKRQSRNS